MPVDGGALQETAGYPVPSREGRSGRHRGACLGDDGDGGELPPVQGGAEGTEECVLAYNMVSPLTSSRDKLRRAMLSCSLSSSRWLVKSMRLLPGLRKSRIAAIAATAAAPT